MKVSDIIRLTIEGVFVVACYQSGWLLGTLALALMANTELQTLVNARLSQRITFLESALLNLATSVNTIVKSIKI